MAAVTHSVALIFLLIWHGADAQSSLSFSENAPFNGDTIQLTCNSTNVPSLEHLASMTFWRVDIPLMYHYGVERNCTSGEVVEMNKGLEIRLASFPHFQWTVYRENSGHYYNCLLISCAEPLVPQDATQQRLVVLNPLGHPWWIWPTTELVTVQENELTALTFRCRAELINVGDFLTVKLYQAGSPGFNITVQSTEIAKTNVTLSAMVESSFKRDANEYTWFQCYTMNQANPSRSSMINKPLEVLYPTDNIQFSCSNDQSYWTLQELSANHWSLEITGPKDLDYYVTCNSNGLPHPSVRLTKSTDLSVVTGTGSVSTVVRPENELQTVFTLNCDAEYSYDSVYKTHMEYVEVKIVSGAVGQYSLVTVTLLLVPLLSLHFM